VVGVLWGTDGKTVVCVQAGRIHAVLNEAIPLRKDALATPPQREFSLDITQQSTLDGDETVSVTALGVGPRRPTPPVDSDGFGNPEVVDQTAASNETHKYILGFRNEVAREQADTKRTLDALQRQLAGVADSLSKQAAQPLAAQPPMVAPPFAPPLAPSPPPVIEPPKEPEGLKERIQAKLEGQPGFLGKFWQKVDNLDHIWVIIGIVGLVILWKRGGIHHIVEKKRAELEADAEEGGLKGRMAGRLLRVHDGPIGDALGKFEDRFMKQEAALSNLKAKADAALHVATQAAVAVVPGAAPIAAGLGAVNLAKAAIEAAETAETTKPTASAVSTAA
jgi:hypothetical protein